MEYQEPEAHKIVPERIAQSSGRIAVKEAGQRVRRINENSVDREPRQAGVLRYPPVQVQVERDPEYIQAYINMEPTNDWSKFIPPISKIT